MKGQVAIPQTSEEIEECLNDNARMTEIFKAGQFADFTRAYVEKAMSEKLSAQMRAELATGTQNAMREWDGAGMRPRSIGWADGAMAGLEARRARAVRKSRLRNAEVAVDEAFLFRKNAIGSKLDDEHYASNWGEFLNVCYSAEKEARQRDDREEVGRIQDFKLKLRNALGERVPAEGGFLVPEILRSEILMVALEKAIVRPRARIIPMDSLRVPLPMIDDTSHASSVYGGVTGYWTEEGAALTASAPSFGRLILEAKKLTAYTTIPNELLQDAVTNLETWFNMFFPRAIAWFEDVAFIGSATTGTGTGEPQGFLNAPAAIKLNSSATNVVAFVDVATMYSRMWPGSLTNAVWICSPDTLLELMQLAVQPLPTTGGTTQTVAPPGWLTAMQAIDGPGGGTQDGYTYRLMGRPLLVSEKMPSYTSGNTTTSGALTFIDLDYYLIGDRMAMQVASSEEYLFANDLVAYRVIERVDGRFWLQSAITPENGSTNTLSPVVLLDTPHA